MSWTLILWCRMDRAGGLLGLVGLPVRFLLCCSQKTFGFLIFVFRKDAYGLQRVPNIAFRSRGHKKSKLRPGQITFFSKILFSKIHFQVAVSHFLVYKSDGQSPIQADIPLPGHEELLLESKTDANKSSFFISEKNVVVSGLNFCVENLNAQMFPKRNKMCALEFGVHSKRKRSKGDSPQRLFCESRRWGLYDFCCVPFWARKELLESCLANWATDRPFSTTQVFVNQLSWFLTSTLSTFFQFLHKLLSNTSAIWVERCETSLFTMVEFRIWPFTKMSHFLGFSNHSAEASKTNSEFVVHWKMFLNNLLNLKDWHFGSLRDGWVLDSSKKKNFDWSGKVRIKRSRCPSLIKLLRTQFTGVVVRYESVHHKMSDSDNSQAEFGSLNFELCNRELMKFHLI